MRAQPRFPLSFLYSRNAREFGAPRRRRPVRSVDPLSSIKRTKFSVNNNRRRGTGVDEGRARRHRNMTRVSGANYESDPDAPGKTRGSVTRDFFHEQYTRKFSGNCAPDNGIFCRESGTSVP